MGKKKKKLRKIDGACALFAMRTATNRCDGTIIDACIDEGWSPEFGLEEHEWLAAAKKIGIRLRRMNLKKGGIYSCELRKFIKHNPTGHFFIYTDGHLFVVKDGNIIDPLYQIGKGLRRKVTGAWRVL